MLTPASARDISFLERFQLDMIHFVLTEVIKNCLRDTMFF